MIPGILHENTYVLAYPVPFGISWAGRYISAQIKWYWGIFQLPTAGARSSSSIAQRHGAHACSNHHRSIVELLARFDPFSRALRQKRQRRHSSQSWPYCMHIGHYALLPQCANGILGYFWTRNLSRLRGPEIPPPSALGARWRAGLGAHPAKSAVVMWSMACFETWQDPRVGAQQLPRPPPYAQSMVRSADPARRKLLGQRINQLDNPL